MTNTYSRGIAAITLALTLSIGTSAPAATTPAKKATVSADLQERKTQRTLAKRNAAAKSLKASLGKNTAPKNSMPDSAKGN